MGGNPLDAKERIGRLAIVTAGRRRNEVVDELFDVLPKVVVGVRSGGAKGVKNFAEVGDNSLVVTADEHGVRGMLDNVGDSAEFGAVGAVELGVKGLRAISFAPRGNKHSPARVGNKGVEGIQRGAVGEDLNEMVAVNFLPIEVGDIVVYIPINMRFSGEQGVDAVVAVRR